MLHPLAAGIGYFDLLFLKRPRTIACAVLQGPSGVALIDPGPSTTLLTLRRELERAGIRIDDVSAILLTHIHLDHAGATGTLAQENPGLRVFVHERGAPHLADPSKLLASAGRLYGGDMERLWGDVRPVPSACIVPLAGGEQLEVAGRRWDVAYTPGHASHHVSYFSADTGVACVGDTAGIRVVHDAVIVPPTPPPDIDLPVWRASLARLSEWSPKTLFLTHFGPSIVPAPHLAEVEEQLEADATLVRQSLARDEPDDARMEWFTDAMRRKLRQRMSEEAAGATELAARFDLCWLGLARYWRKTAGLTR